MDKPRLGDAFGAMLQATYDRPGTVVEIVERSDGFIDAHEADRYLRGPADWPAFDQRALAAFEGSTLDIGTGGGRLALALQERGVPVVALDTSPGAVAVCAARGVRSTVCATIDDHATDPAARYDRFALFGNNLGLIQSRERAPSFLAAMAAMARPGAIVVAQGTDPTGTDDEDHRSYQAANVASGRLAGELRIRVRFRHLATEWFHYLLCTPDELAELVHGSPWELSDVDTTDAPSYLAILRLSAAAGRR